MYDGYKVYVSIMNHFFLLLYIHEHLQTIFKIYFFDWKIIHYMFPAYCVLLIVTVKTLKVFDQYTGTMLLCLVVYLSNTPKLYIQINMPFHFKECFNTLMDILFKARWFARSCWGKSQGKRRSYDITDENGSEKCKWKENFRP